MEASLSSFWSSWPRCWLLVSAASPAGRGVGQAGPYESSSRAGHLSQRLHPCRDPAPPPKLISFTVRKHRCELGIAKSGSEGRERHPGISQRTAVLLHHNGRASSTLPRIRRRPWLRSLLPQSCSTHAASARHGAASCFVTPERPEGEKTEWNQ